MPRPRARPRRSRDGSEIKQLPVRPLVNPLPPIEVLDGEQIERIHDASLQVLEEIGMDFLHADALAILRRAGAEVTAGSERVRFDRGLIAESLASAPASFTMHARNPAHDLAIGANHINFGTVGSAPNSSDLDGGRRVGNFDDYCNFLRLGQCLNIVHFFGGYPVEPVDLHPDIRHLDCVRLPHPHR